jgi:hypothetical protein
MTTTGNAGEVQALLMEANCAGLSVTTRADRLVVRGPKDAEPLMRRLLARKPDVLAALDAARRLTELWRKSGHRARAVGASVIRLRPPLAPESAMAARLLKPALIAYLRGVAPDFLQALDDEEDAPGIARSVLPAPIAPPMPVELTVVCQGNALSDPVAAPRVCDRDLHRPWPPVYSFPIDWHQEYLLERTALCRRIADCYDPVPVAEIEAMILTPEPTTEAEWIALGTKWRAKEHQLRQESRMPAYDWPVLPRSPGDTGKQS